MGAPDPYLPMPDIARIFRVGVSTARRWAAEDGWRRRGTRAKVYRFADAQGSYDRRRRHAVRRRLARRHGEAVPVP